MTPLGWGWAGFVWGYAIAWALLADRIKLLAYRVLDPSGQRKAADSGIDHKTPASARARE